MPSTSDVAVIVGRFQVHKLTDAQHALIDSVYQSHPSTVVVLGLSQARLTIRNPLDFEARRRMLLDSFPRLTVLYLKDEADDDVWSKKLDDLIAPVVTPAQSVCLYGGRDSFKAYYTGRYPVVEFDEVRYVSGTEQRRSITRAVRGTEDFRAGVIWASANVYPRVFPCVDIAILRDDRMSDRRVVPGIVLEDQLYGDGPRSYDAALLVRKPSERLWRLPGGFVDPHDETWEAGAKREAREEVGVEIDTIRYVGSFRIDDWRYRRELDRIVTTLFVANYVFGPVVAADDVAEARWMALSAPDTEIVPEHRPLWHAVGAFLVPQQTETR